MGLRGGDTFQVADRKRDPHPWVVLSDPENHPQSLVLIANLTTRRADTEAACVLVRGDHPFIEHESCVNYQDSRLVKGPTLEAALARNVLLARQPFGASALRRIRNGATASRLMPLRNLQLPRDQGLVE